MAAPLPSVVLQALADHVDSEMPTVFAQVFMLHHDPVTVVNSKLIKRGDKPYLQIRRVAGEARNNTGRGGRAQETKTYEMTVLQHFRRTTAQDQETQWDMVDAFTKALEDVARQVEDAFQPSVFDPVTTLSNDAAVSVLSPVPIDDLPINFGGVVVPVIVTVTFI